MEALRIALHGYPTPLPALINSQSVPAPCDPNVAAVRTCLSEATAADLRYSGTSSPPIVRRIHVDTGGDDLDLHFGGPHGRVCHEDDLAHEVADHPSDFAAPEGGGDALLRLQHGGTDRYVELLRASGHLELTW
ncbi:MAG: hypothetical protein ACRDRK_22880 [Pseudonocardia sp.]